MAQIEAAIPFTLPVPQGQEDSALRQRLLTDAKRDLVLAFVYTLPHLKNFQSSYAWMADQAGISESEVKDYVSQFVRAGLWKTDENGRYQVVEQLIEQKDVKVNEFRTMAMSLAARMSDDGDCWYQSFVFATNQAAYEEFKRNINRAIQDFFEKSGQVEADTIIAWNHSTINCTAGYDPAGKCDA